MAVTQVKQFEQPFNERYNLSWDDITVAGKKNFFVSGNSGTKPHWIIVISFPIVDLLPIQNKFQKSFTRKTHFVAKTFTSNGRLKGFDSDKGSCLEGNPKKHKSSLLQFYDNDTSKHCQGNRFKIWPLCILHL